MTNRKCQLWGDWAIRRARHIGSITRIELAKSVGCSVDVLARWLQLESAPNAMRKGFDESLCRALRTDKFTLFTDYVNIAPEDAPIIDLDEIETCGMDAAPLRRKLDAIGELLPPDRLREFVETGERLLRAAAA